MASGMEALWSLRTSHPALELVKWNGPTSEEYAVFELDAKGERTSEYPVSTGTFESEIAYLNARMQ